jgi:hypothetical protein
VTKETKGRRRRTVPIIDPLRPTLVRLTRPPPGAKGQESAETGGDGESEHGRQPDPLTPRRWLRVSRRDALEPVLHACMWH